MSINSARNEIFSNMETKLMNSLQWSMLFFIFRHAVNDILTKNQSNNDFNKTLKDQEIYKDFFKNWKILALENIVKNDINNINNILNSPKNMFHAILQNQNETIESTELYQDKYNEMLKKIENFFCKNLNLKD